MYEPSKCVQDVTHLSCICGTNIVTGVFCCCCECGHSLCANTGIVLLIRSWPHIFMSLPVHYAWIILPFHMWIIWYTESVIKPDVNMYIYGLKLPRWQQWILLGRTAVSLWNRYWPGWLLVTISLQIQILLLLLPFVLGLLACFPSIWNIGSCRQSVGLLDGWLSCRKAATYKA
jgi:hypothetical protein